MKTVAVLGGGPAGAFAAEQLASQGLRPIVFDEKLAWEKPCGGGLTYKAYHRYPFLIDNATPKKVVHETVLAAPKRWFGLAQTPIAAADLLAPRSESVCCSTRAIRAGAANRKNARAGH